MKLCGTDLVVVLKVLPDGQDVVLDGELWIRRGDFFDIHPYALQGDYETEANFIRVSDLEDEFIARKIYTLEQ